MGSIRSTKLKQIMKKLQIKILPYSPDILCLFSLCLNKYTDSCNCMLNKLSLRKCIQAKSKYLSMEQVLNASRNNVSFVNSKMPVVSSS